MTAGTAVLLTGCGSRVEAVPAEQAGNPLCAEVAGLWPKMVGGSSQVRTTAGSDTVAAWGDPAIVARCGVTSPGPTTKDCISANGVDWVALPLDDGTRFVSYGRSPAIEVLVPSSYDPAPFVLSAFSQAAEKIPQGEHKCG